MPFLQNFNILKQNPKSFLANPLIHTQKIWKNLWNQCCKKSKYSNIFMLIQQKKNSFKKRKKFFFSIYLFIFRNISFKKTWFKTEQEFIKKRQETCLNARMGYEFLILDMVGFLNFCMLFDSCFLNEFLCFFKETIESRK